MDWSKMPLAPDLDPKLTERRVRDSVIAEGRAAYRAGLPITKCPRFTIEDMAIDWRNGWRWESEGQ